MAYTFACPTRWGDMDAYRHLNNGSYVDYLQEARVDFLHSGDFAYMLGDEPVPGGSEPNPQGILVTGHRVEYLRPAEHGAPVEVHLVVEQIGVARLTLAYDLSSAGRTVARARTVLCPVDLRTHRIRRLSERERSWFAGHAEAVPPLRTVPKARIGAHPAHEHALRVRWSDLDSYRHANNVRYYDYVQEARLALLRQVTDERPADAERPGQWAVVRQDVDYAVQIDFRREPYLIRTAVQEMGESSLTLAAEIIDPLSGTMHAASRTVLVHTTDHGAISLPVWIRAALEPWRLPSS